MGKNIEDLRMSSSAIDNFWNDKRPARIASSGKVRIAGLSDLSGFHFVGQDTLVRLSQQDFWKLGQDESGHYIEKLVSDDEGPVTG